MPEPSVFGRRLRERREKRDWTQEKLAEKSGVSAAMISHFETGTRGTASADNLVKLASALGVSIDYLLGRADEPELRDERVEATFRRLSDASGDTIEQAVRVVEALLDADRKEDKEG